jgi:hypothetical protein
MVLPTLPVPPTTATTTIANTLGQFVKVDELIRRSCWLVHF